MELAIMMVLGGLLLMVICFAQLFTGGWTGIERVEKRRSSFPNHDTAGGDSDSFTSKNKKFLEEMHRSSDEIVDLKKREDQDFIRQSIEHGISLTNDKRYGDAITVFEKVLVDDPTNGRACWNLAVCYDRIDNRKKAVTYYRKCLKHNPNVAVYKNLGLVYFRLEDLKNAKKYLEKASCGDDVFMFLGICYLGFDELDKADKMLHKISDKTSEFYNKLFRFVSAYKIEQERMRQENAKAEEDETPINDNLNNFYAVLDLNPGATKSDIKQAYRDMSKVWHPDRYGHDLRLQKRAEQKMKEINAAYQALS